MKAALSRIDSHEREQHFYLKPEHRCWFWGEYTPWGYTYGSNADYSETNRLIADLKVPPERREDAQDWGRKEAAIERASEAFARFWRWSDLADKVLLVPVPGSRSRSDPLYDDRMERVVAGISAKAGIELAQANLLASDGSLESSHTSSQRPQIQRLMSSIMMDTAALPASSPEMVFLFDDVLTTGAHFVASSNHLLRLYPNARVIGNFIARTRRPAPDEWPAR